MENPSSQRAQTIVVSRSCMDRISSVFAIVKATNRRRTLKSYCCRNSSSLLQGMLELDGVVSDYCEGTRG